MDALVHHVSNVVPMALNVADGVKNNVRFHSIEFGFPDIWGRNNRHATALSSCLSWRKHFERENTFSTDCALMHRAVKQNKPSKSMLHPHFSKSLLRVNDLNIVTESGEMLFFIDLSPDFSDEQLSLKAFEASAVGRLGLGIDRDREGPNEVCQRH
jgi:hypothetical protein